MAQNQNPGMGNPMGPQRNPGDIASMLTSMGRPGGGMQPSGPPQGAPGQGPGGGKGQQIAGLQGGPKPSMGGGMRPMGGPGGPQQPIQWGGPPPGGAMRPMGGPPPGGLGGAIQNLTSQGGAAGQQPNMWGTATMPPKNPNAPPPPPMPGMTQGPASLGGAYNMGQAGSGLAAQGQNANAALLQGRKMMGQGAPGQGAGGGKNQQMATLPGGPR